MLISVHFSSSQRTLEGHKTATDLLALHQLFFTVKVQRLQNWPVTDGEQVCLKICLVVNAGPGRSHEDIARTPLEAHTVDHREAAALKDYVDGTARLALRGCACAGIEAVHLARQGTPPPGPRQPGHALHAHHRTAPGPGQ